MRPIISLVKGEGLCFPARLVKTLNSKIDNVSVVHFESLNICMGFPPVFLESEFLAES